jgi:hypothetical protein
MAVETLSIISSPLAGLAMSMNSGMGGIRSWMTGHGINPTHMAAGAIIGAIVGRESILEGALRGALIVGGLEGLIYLISRHIGSA